MIKKFKKKPVEIEAVQLTAGNIHSVAEWCGGEVRLFSNRPTLVIKTLEGDMVASPSIWIIKGVQGEFYPCKKEIFEETYELSDIGKSEEK